jgi:hypothetical protein
MSFTIELANRLLRSLVKLPPWSCTVGKTLGAIATIGAEGTRPELPLKPHLTALQLHNTSPTFLQEGNCQDGFDLKAKLRGRQAISGISMHTDKNCNAV